MPILFLISQAFASSQYYYSEQLVAKKSVVFKQTAEDSQKQLSEIEQTLTGRSDLIQSIELASYLTDQSEIRRQVIPLKKELLGVQTIQQAFFDKLQINYSKAFIGALERAIKSLKYSNIKPCASKGHFGSSKCSGTDKSADIAKQIDKDAKLKSELKKISSMRWPSSKWTKIAYKADDKKSSYVDIAVLAKRFIPKRLKEIEAQFDFSYRQAKRSHSKDKAAFISAVSKAKDRYIKRLADEGLFLKNLLSEMATGDKGCLFGLINARAPIEQLDNVEMCAYPANSKICPGSNKSDFTMMAIKKSKHYSSKITARNQLPLSK